MMENSPQKYVMGHVSGVIRQSIKEAIILCGFDPEHFKIDLIISIAQIRNGVIRDEYKKLMSNGESRDEAMAIIAEEFGMTDSREYLINIIRRKV